MSHANQSNGVENNGVEDVSSLQQHQTLFRFGTLNVHGFVNGHGEDAYEATVQLLQKAELDVMALQEVGRKKLPALCSALGGGNGRKPVWNYTNKNNCAILSRFPVERVDDKDKTLRCCWARVALPGCPPVLLDVVSVHLDYRRETTRMQELDKLVAMLDTAANHQSRNMVWMGDFNALTQSDYTDLAWSQIADVRARNSWEAPQTDVIRRITDKAPKRRKRPGLGLIDTYHQLPAPARAGPLSTCRFGTRIDYIFLTPGFPARVVSHEHVEALPFASDHNAVVVTLNFE